MKSVLLVALLALAAPAGAQPRDAVDLSTAILTPRSGNTRTVTATITRIDLQPSALRIEFDRKDGPDRWPNVPVGLPGSGDNYQYSVWIGAHLTDGWHLAATNNVWFGLDPIADGVTDPAEYPRNMWYLDAALLGHTPVVGESLAFFVTAGGDRNSDAHLVLERSNVVVVPMPGPAGASYTFAAPPVITPPPVIIPPPVVTPPPIVTPPPVVTPAPAPLPSTDLSPVMAMLAQYQAATSAQLAELKAQLAAVATNVQTFRAEVEGKWNQYIGPIAKWAAIFAAGILAKWKLLGG